MNRFRALAACLFLLGLLGCSSNNPSWFGGTTTVTIVIDQEINQNSPIAVEVLVVYDATLLGKLAATSAGDWFKNRDQFRRDYPDGFVSQYWEWVPGQTVDQQEIAFTPGARAGLVYADYQNNKDNRERFDPHQDIKIHLSQSTFTLELVK